MVVIARLYLYRVRRDLLASNRRKLLRYIFGRFSFLEELSQWLGPHKVIALKFQWEIEGSEQEDPMEKLLLDPFDTVKWKVKPVEKITRFVKGSTVAAKLEKVRAAVIPVLHISV